MSLERIALLLHILCDLHFSHGITSQKLKNADQSVRSKIAPVERLTLLDELYRVRAEEEKVLEGFLGRGIHPLFIHNLTNSVQEKTQLFLFRELIYPHPGFTANRVSWIVGSLWSINSIQQDTDHSLEIEVFAKRLYTYRVTSLETPTAKNL